MPLGSAEESTTLCFYIQTQRSMYLLPDAVLSAETWMILTANISWLPMTITSLALPSLTREISLPQGRKVTILMSLFGTIIRKGPFSDFPSMIMEYPIWLSPTMIYFWYLQETSLMESFLSGTLVTVILWALFKSLHRYSLTAFPQSAGVDLSRISNWEIQLAINLPFLEAKSWLFGLLIQLQELAITRLWRQELWWETINAWLSLSPTRNSFSSAQSQESSALSRSRTRCLCSVNRFVQWESNVFRLWPMTKSALEVVTDKLCCFMLIKTFVRAWWLPSYMAVSRVSAQVKMECRCWLPPTRVSSIDWESVTSLRCFLQRTMLSQSITLTTWMASLTSLSLALRMAPSDFGTPTTTQSRQDASTRSATPLESHL